MRHPSTRYARELKNSCCHLPPSKLPMNTHNRQSSISSTRPGQKVCRQGYGERTQMHKVCLHKVKMTLRIYMKNTIIYVLPSTPSGAYVHSPTFLPRVMLSTAPSSACPFNSAQKNASHNRPPLAIVHQGGDSGMDKSVEESTAACSNH